MRVKDSEHVPMILVGNKCDLPNYAVTNQQALQQAQNWGLEYFETSAKTRKCVEDIFHRSVCLIKAYREGHSQKKNKKKGCRLL